MELISMLFPFFSPTLLLLTLELIALILSLEPRPDFPIAPGLTTFQTGLSPLAIKLKPLKPMLYY